MNLLFCISFHTHRNPVFTDMLKIEKSKRGSKVELFQVNRFNTLFADLVRNQLAELVREPGAEVSFNLEGIRFIDSSGFAVLTEISELARECGSSFRLCNVTEDVKELIHLLGLESSFEFGTLENTSEKILAVLD